MTALRHVTLLAALVAATGCSQPAPATRTSADLILHNGEIWTVDPNRPSARAIAIRGDTITAVGSDNEVMPRAGPSTRVIDLAGRFVVPGFNDTHVHLASAARFLEFNLMQTSSQEEFEALVREVVADLPDGEWILGGFWGAYDQWAAGSAGSEAREPFRPDLGPVQELTARHPLFIRKFDNSEYAVNAAALAVLGIDPAAPRVNGVTFETDDSGRCTGVFHGPGAARLFMGAVPRRFSTARRIRQTEHALRQAARYGVTSLSDMSDDGQLEIYEQLHERGELTVRVHFRYGLERWSELEQRGVAVGSGDDWIRLGALKGHIDGIMGTSSARFFAPYTNAPDNRGRWRKLMVDEQGQFVEGQFLGHMHGADDAGLQMSVHAIGDEANHLLLDYLEELDKRGGVRERRFRLVHAQVIAEADFARLGELRVIAEVQPYHLSDDMRWMAERIGHERCRGAYAFRKIAESGAVLCFGSDWPGTSASVYPINPMLGIYAAVTRQTTRGEPAEGWFPDQRISVEDAIAAYTWAGAYSSFEEDRKGSLTAGKMADLAVLSRNLRTCSARDILDTEVVYTIVGGRVVHGPR